MPVVCVVDVLVPGGTVCVGVLVPAAPGVVAGALVVGVVVAGVVVAGVVAAGVLVAGSVPGGGVLAAAGALEDVVVALTVSDAEDPESPASETSAAISAPSDSTPTTASPITSAFQFGAAASRVRAAAPQRRHHSCVRCSGAPHSGHASPLGGGGWGGMGAKARVASPAGWGADGEALTNPAPAGG